MALGENAPHSTSIDAEYQQLTAEAIYSTPTFSGTHLVEPMGFSEWKIRYTELVLLEGVAYCDAYSLKAEGDVMAGSDKMRSANIIRLTRISMEMNYRRYYSLLKETFDEVI